MDILFCVLCTVCEIVVLQIHSHPPISPIPSWAKKIFLKKIASVLFVRVATGDDSDCNHDNDGDTKTLRESLASSDKLNDVMSVEMDARRQSENGYDELRRLLFTYDSRLAEDIASYIRRRKKLMKTDEKRRLYEEEWRDLARVIDRMFLCVWFVVIGFCSIFVFLTLIRNSANLT